MSTRLNSGLVQARTAKQPDDGHSRAARNIMLLVLARASLVSALSLGLLMTLLGHDKTLIPNLYGIEYGIGTLTISALVWFLELRRY